MNRGRQQRLVSQSGRSSSFGAVYPVQMLTGPPLCSAAALAALMEPPPAPQR